MFGTRSPGPSSPGQCTVLAQRVPFLGTLSCLPAVGWEPSIPPVSLKACGTSNAPCPNKQHPHGNGCGETPIAPRGFAYARVRWWNGNCNVIQNQISDLKKMTFRVRVKPRPGGMLVAGAHDGRARVYVRGVLHAGWQHTCSSTTEPEPFVSRHQSHSFKKTQALSKFH
jgi:hypothetical protein